MDNYRKKNPKGRQAQSLDGFIRVDSGAQRIYGPNTGRQPVFSDRLKAASAANREVGPASAYVAQPQSARIDQDMHKAMQPAMPPQSTTGQSEDDLQPTASGQQRSAPGQSKPDRTSAKSNSTKSTKPAHAKSGRKTREDRSKITKPKSPRAAARLKKREKKRAKWLAQPKWKRILKRIGLVLIILMVIVAGFFAFKGYLKLRQIFQGGGYSAALDGNADPSKLKGEGDGRVNILLLGRGGVGHDGADLTDTILVASIDPVNNKTALVSVPRDLWVRTEYGSTKINAVFANAKNSALAKGDKTIDAETKAANVLKKEVGEVLGISMHYYSIIDFKGFGKAVDTLGGVTLDVPKDLRDYSMAWLNNGRSLLVPAGKQTLDSKHALWYVRSRHSGRGDFDRSERQRLFIQALVKEITSVGTYGNPATVSRLMDDFGDHIRTDFSLNEIMRLYDIGKQMGKIESIGLVDEPHDYLTTDNIGGQSVVVPKAGLFDYKDIQLYIRKALPDGYIIKEKSPIIILNGTSMAGLGTDKSDELKTYGYNVVKVDNAPTTNYSRTVIVDLTDGKGKYTRNYLEKRFRTRATTKLPEGINKPDKPGFVIILGSN